MSSPEFQNFLKYDGYYKPDEIDKVISMTMSDAVIIKKKKLDQYYNISASFDIETTSFYIGNEKYATMYEWTFGLNGLCIIGRTWDEFFTMLDYISDRLGLSGEGLKLVVYVHNLSWEFQFIRCHLEWFKTFSLSARKPIYAISENGFEFRCSYILSGYGLAKLGDQLLTYKVRKMVGDLDYYLLRNSITPLTDKEIGYCLNDVKVVMAYIQELIEREGNITKIPLTKTGFVRRYCRNACFYEKDKSRKKSFKRFRYTQLMKCLTLDKNEYMQLKRAFRGGYVHANPFTANKTIHNASSDDFTSSYTAVCVSERFPMGKAEQVGIKSKEEFEHNLKYYCCLFDIELEGLESTFYIDNYISVSGCWNTKNVQVNNGRVVRADKIALTVTEQDFAIIKKTYKWKKIKIGTFRRYIKDYLPSDLVGAMLDLYANKTSLKNIDEFIAEYRNSKEMLNSTYGMMVMDVIQSLVTYDNINGWSETLPDMDEALEKYNNSYSRFLFYPWGVWVTAYARRNLWTGILNFGEDYLYSDTDSIKSRNRNKHLDYIEKYNNRIREQLIRAMNYHGFDVSRIEPKTKKGVKKCLGVWDYEGDYRRFKTLGAKRYMVEYFEPVCYIDKDGKETDKPIIIGKHPLMRRRINITVAGINKIRGVSFLTKEMHLKEFESFTDKLTIPAKSTGKMTHTYIDYPQDGLLTDYLGNTAEFHELSSIHLENAEYSLSMAPEYIDYIKGVQYATY